MRNAGFTQIHNNVMVSILREIYTKKQREIVLLLLTILEWVESKLVKLNLMYFCWQLWDWWCHFILLNWGVQKIAITDFFLSKIWHRFTENFRRNDLMEIHSYRKNGPAKFINSERASRFKPIRQTNYSLRNFNRTWAI